MMQTATGKLEIIGDVTSTVMTRSFVAASRYGRCMPHALLVK